MPSNDNSVKKTTDVFFFIFQYSLQTMPTVFQKINSSIFLNPLKIIKKKFFYLEIS